jgi:nucleotidyltransferase-like protein
MSERDPSGIGAERDRTLARMVQYFLDQKGTKALFLSGSVAAGQTDEYSDIDFRVVVDPPFYEEFLARRMTAPAPWGDLLFNQCRPGTNHSVSHFRPFFKVDTFYYRPHELLPSPWYTLPTRVLFDPGQIIQRIIQESRGLRFVPTIEQVEHSINFGLAAAHEVLRRVSRGELAYAHSILDELRRALVDADDYLHERPWYGFSHLETRAEASFVATIHGSYCSLDKEAICESLARLAEVYREQVVALHRRFGLERDLGNDVDSLDIIWNINTGSLRPPGTAVLASPQDPPAW